MTGAGGSDIYVLWDLPAASASLSFQFLKASDSWVQGLFFHLYFLFVLGGFWFLIMATPVAKEVPRLGIESELQLPAYTTATATPDLSPICVLHHSSWQCWILNPLSEARDRTHILMDTGRMSPLSHDGNSQNVCLKSRTLPYFCLNSSLSKKIYLFLLTKVESQVHTIDLFSDWR